MIFSKNDDSIILYSEIKHYYTNTLTLIDINNELIIFFQKNNTFSFKRDVSKIKIPEDYVEYTEPIIRSTLDLLCKREIIVKLTDDCFILKQPLNSYIQNVSISPNIATAILDKIKFLGNEDEENDIDILSITENEIVKLLMIIDILLENVKDTDKKEEE